MLRISTALPIQAVAARGDAHGFVRRESSRPLSNWRIAGLADPAFSAKAEVPRGFICGPFLYPRTLRKVFRGDQLAILPVSKTDEWKVLFLAR